MQDLLCFDALPILLIACACLLVGPAQRACAAEDDAALKSLAVEGHPLTPGFSAQRFAYAVRVPHNADGVTIIAEAAEPSAAVTVNGVRVGAGPPVRVPAAVGIGKVLVEVTAADASRKNVYALEVTRSYPTLDWVRVQETCPFSARDSAGELVFDNRMWLIGGYTPPLVSDVWTSSDGVQWTPASPLPSAAGVNIPVRFVHAGRMWVSANDGALFASRDGASWELVTNDAPWKGRYGAGSLVFAGKMWVMGGMKNGRELYNDVWSSEDGLTWTLETANAAWSRRQPFGMAAVFQDRMWLVGGGIGGYHPFKAYNDVWSSADGKQWDLVTSDAPWPGRIWSSAAVYKNRLWVLGGFRAEPEWKNFDDVWYSMDGRDWNRLETETAWSPRHEISVYVFSGALWTVAGNAWPLQQDAWRLDIPGLTFVTQPVVEEFVSAQYRYEARADFNESCGSIHYRLLESPAWLSAQEDTGRIGGTPETPGEFPVVIEARDDAGETARQAYTLHVIPFG